MASTRVLRDVVIAAGAVTASLTTPAAAQCSGAGWLPSAPSRLDGSVSSAVVWDPDGAGPIPPSLVVAGDLRVGAGTNLGPVDGIAALDLTTGTWSKLGSGLTGWGLSSWISTLAVLPSGKLVVSGDFTFAGDVRVDGLAAWNGTKWEPIWTLGVGSRPCSRGCPLAVASNGDLIVGAVLPVGNGQISSRFLRWNGSTLSDVSVSGARVVRVNQTLLMPNGDLIVVGDFVLGDPPSETWRIDVIARLRGSELTILDDGPGRPRTLGLLPGGGLVAAFTAPGVSGPAGQRIARLDESGWTTIGATQGRDSVAGFTTLPNGSLLAFGSLREINGVQVGGLARWNGSAWSALGPTPINESGYDMVLTAAVIPGGDVVFAGSFERIGEVPSDPIARWNGSDWSPVNTRLQDVRALTPFFGGELLAGARAFVPNAAQTNSQTGVYRWDGSAWSLLGPEMSYAASAIAVLPDGGIVAAGAFQVGVGDVRKLAGLSWVPFGSGVSGSVSALLAMPNGDLFAGGWISRAGSDVASGIARWDGTHWSSMLGGVTDESGERGEVQALARLPDGSVVASGRFATAGGIPAANIARWDGSAWSPLGLGIDGFVGSLAVLENGDLIAGGIFTTAGGVAAANIARWNGSAWSPIDQGVNGWVSDLAPLPGGGLLVGGSFTNAGGVSASGIARWDGTAWSPLGTGVGVFGSPGSVSSLAVLGDGTLAVAGGFWHAGGLPADGIARYSFTGVPTLAKNPVPTSTQVGLSLTLSAQIARGFPGVAVEWRRNGLPIADGPGGASVGGGTVTGAAGTLASPTSGAPSVLTIANVQLSDAGSYTAVFTNPCGSVQTRPATVTVTPVLTGACCSGAACTLVVQAACIGPNTRFLGPVGACNAPGNNTSPCCRADFDHSGVRERADVFAFLAAYFSNDPILAAQADVDNNGVRQPADIFAFLTAYLAGC
jgi:trimeric autotransporter adhesin